MFRSSRWILLAHCVCAVLATSLAVSVRASSFRLDPSLSYLELSGDLTGAVTLPMFPQAPGSLRTSLQGDLFIDLLTPGSLRITGMSIDGLSQPGPFQPGGGPAELAGRVDEVAPGIAAFAAIRDTFLYGTSHPIALGPVGDFSGSDVWLRFQSNQLAIHADTILDYQTPFFANLINGPFQAASLQTVGNEYRLTLPVRAQSSFNVFGLPFNYTLSGQLTATRPIAGALERDILNGGFEDIFAPPGSGIDFSTTGWTMLISGPEGNIGGVQNPENIQRPQATEGHMHAFLNVVDSTNSMYQTIIPAGELQPDTRYIVSFDVGNRDMTDNGRLPNNDMDPFISVRGFFTLGDDLADASQSLGLSFELPQLSSVAEGTWLRHRQAILDTAGFTPEQLAQGLNFVLQATSTTDINRGQVDFDNVRLQIVPEPTTLALALLGAAGLFLMRSSRRRR